MSSTPTENDPTGRHSHEMGAKLDEGKAPIFRGLLQYFPRAIKAVSYNSLYGSLKYAWKSWQEVPDGFGRYSDAMGRHIIDEETDLLGPGDEVLMELLGRVVAKPTPQLLHATQAAWNAMARLELLIRNMENADQNNSVGGGRSKQQDARPRRGSRSNRNAPRPSASWAER